MPESPAELTRTLQAIGVAAWIIPRIIDADWGGLEELARIPKEWWEGMSEDWDMTNPQTKKEVKQAQVL